ncbi:MAG TPA: amino acid adenylation domain-containing protein, partial [Polyangiaceae bacterium]
LQQAGFVILGVHSADGSAAEWSKNCGVEYHATRKDFEASLDATEFEWLFSLNNPWVIPASVLRLPKLGTINYHDSPLPRYRGLYATTWALIHGETSHAVSFHEVTESIDEGRILRQSAVPIVPEDTAWTLNAKCFETAIATFRELVLELVRIASVDQLNVTLQDDRIASYFGRWARPPKAAFIDFREPAEAIHDLVRALDFGPIDNPFAIPKLLVENRVYAVGHAEVLSQSTHSCGELVQAATESIDVATSTRVIRLSRITSLIGGPVDAMELARAVNGQPKPCLPCLSVQEANTLTERYIELCRNESFWHRQLRSARQPELGFQVGGIQRPEASAQLSNFSRALGRYAGVEPLAVAASCVAAFLAKVNHFEGFDLGLVLTEADPLIAALTAPVVPLRIEANADQSLTELATSIETGIALVRARGSFCQDLVLRYPELRIRGEFRARVAIGAYDRAPKESSAELFIGVNDETREVSLTHHGKLDPWQVSSIDDLLTQLLKSLQAIPNESLAQVPWLSETLRRQVLVGWNDSEHPLPELSMTSLIEAVALRQPDANAVRFAGYSLSYAELTHRSRLVARRLIEQGVRTGDLVALSLPRSVEMVVAMVAILRAGAAYLPIDPSYPAARGRAMLDGAHVSVAITCEGLRDKFFGQVAQLILFDEQPETLRTVAVPSSRTTDLPEARPDGLFCVIYTSGSTGKPKGVEVTQRGMVNHALAIARNYELGPNDRVLCSASLSFDVVGEQIYPALVSGAEVVIRPEDLFDSFRGFDDFIRSEQVTVMILPTSFWHEWTRELVATNSMPPESLRALSVGTEKALGERLSQWQAVSAGRVRFFQGYGPTETTITSTMYLHDGGNADTELPIGRPLTNTQVYLLDRHMQPVPPGMLGELFIAGAGVARGYRNDPALTAERFLKCPFVEDGRMYRTGDLARFRPDGQLVFCGRADSQVKIRGFRVELAEIETALCAQPNVSEALVSLRTDHGDPQLVAYVVPRSSEIDVTALLAALEQRLPHYMVPQSVVTLAQFPKTPNQKIDKQALPMPARPLPVERKVSAVASNPLQLSLVEIWRTLLGIQPSIDEDFFALGGHSLLAVRMLSMVERAHQKLVPLSCFVQNPTVSGLARELGMGEAKSSLLVTVRAGTTRPPLWLVHPVGGHVAYAYRLREYMAPHQPIIGFQAQGVDGKLPPLETVQQMAHIYVKRMREVQKTGPYFVAGPSMGGLIALEMAQVLRRQAQDVALLALIDTWGPGYPRPTSRLQKVIDQARTIWRQPSWQERITLVRGRSRRHFQISAGPGGKAIPPRYDALAGTNVSAELLHTIQRVWQANERANLAYEPSVYDGAVLLLRAKSTLHWSGMRFDDPYNGWRGLVKGPFDCQVVDCSHSELADNPPQAAAVRLQTAIDAIWEKYISSDVQLRAS